MKEIKRVSLLNKDNSIYEIYLEEKRFMGTREISIEAKYVNGKVEFLNIDECSYGEFFDWSKEEITELQKDSELVNQIVEKIKQ